MSLELELREMFRAVVREVVREELASAPAPETKLSAELLTYEQAAASVKISTSTIKRWVRSGRLEAFGRGKLRRVRAADVRAALAGEQQQQKTTPDVKASVTSILASLPRRK